MLVDSQIEERKTRIAREEAEARANIALTRALTRFIEAKTPKNVQSKLHANSLAMEPIGSASGDAGQTIEHPASFDVSNDIINKQASELKVDPAYIAYLLNRTLPECKGAFSDLDDLTVTVSTVPREKR